MDEGVIQLIKFLKSILSEKEKEIFNYTIKPYTIYSIVNMIFIALSIYGFGKMNDDIGYGLFISWIMQSLILYFNLIAK